MNIEQLIYISPQIISSIIFFMLLMFFLLKKKDSLSVSFIFLLVNMLFWSIMSILELTNPSDEMTILFGELSYISITSIPVLIYIFVFKYLEKYKFLAKKIIFSISIIPAISLFLALTNRFHHLFFIKESINPIKYELTTSVFSRGSFFWIFAIYSYILIFIICFFIIKKLFEKSYIYKKQAFLLLIAILIPFVGNLIFVLKLFGLNFDYDLTIILFIFTAIIFVISIFGYKFLNISLLARNEIFDELSDAIIILNENYELMDCNKSALEFAKNLNIVTCKKGTNAKEALKNTKISFENDSEFSLSKGSTLYYHSSVKKLFINKAFVGIILSIKNITKIKEYEKMKAENEKEKEITNLREEFITRVSHELRQPLMPIIGYSNELKAMVKSGKANEYIEKIIFNSENLKELIEKTIRLTQIKTQSKINMEKRKLSNFSKNLMKDARIKMKIIKDSEVLIDESQMIEAANNIIENALKYSKKEVEIEISEKDKNAIITITDKGKGISKELIKQIIDSSYLAKIDSSELRKGFGIGLLIAKMIIQAHSGKMEIKSEKDKGTTVKIILPISF
ncbi:MAG: histidine kinase N-terminal 7TM domain-containing protein [Candidatus Nanoarchaeia archaeon]|nr:histidine kinase N-terminal 7TM domain-containing protein [Candidatus Nanoarchaeia archaeon]